MGKRFYGKETMKVLDFACQKETARQAPFKVISWALMGT